MSKNRIFYEGVTTENKRVCVSVYEIAAIIDLSNNSQNKVRLILRNGDFIEIIEKFEHITMCVKQD